MNYIFWTFTAMSEERTYEMAWWRMENLCFTYLKGDTKAILLWICPMSYPSFTWKSWYRISHHWWQHKSTFSNQRLRLSREDFYLITAYSPCQNLVQQAWDTIERRITQKQNSTRNLQVQKVNISFVLNKISQILNKFTIYNLRTRSQMWISVKGGHLKYNENIFL